MQLLQFKIMQLLQFLAPCERLWYFRYDAPVQFCSKKARVILFTVWHQICSSPKITSVLTAFKKKQEKSPLWHFFFYMVLLHVPFKILLRAVGSTEFITRKLILEHALWQVATCVSIICQRHSGLIRLLAFSTIIFITRLTLHFWQMAEAVLKTFKPWQMTNTFNSQCVMTDLHIRTWWYTPGTLVLVYMCHLNDRCQRTGMWCVKRMA